MEREKKLLKNTLILSLGTFLPKAASFITLPILTAYMTKEEYGTYDLVTVLVSLLLPAITLQIQNAAFRFLIDCRDDEEEAKRIVTNIFAFLVPVSLITVSVLFFLFPYSNGLVKLLVAVYLLVDILVNAARQIARGINRTADYSVSAIISAAGKLVLAAVCVWWLRLGLLGAVLALLGASFLSLVTITLRIRLFRMLDFSRVSKATILELIRYSWPMVPNSMSLWVMRVSDRFVVTFMMGVAANAVYSVANKIPSLLNLAQSTFTMAWQENASVVSKDKDASAYYSKMFRVIFDFMAGCLGLIICATPLLFVLLIRGDYDEAYCQMPILFLAMFFYSMCSYLGGIYVAYKATKSVGITTICAAACNLAVDIALIGSIGLYAASGSTLVSYLFLFLFRMKDVKRIVSIKFDYKHILLVIALLSLECGLCFPRNAVLSGINLALGIASFYFLNKAIVHGVFKRIRSGLQKVLR